MSTNPSEHPLQELIIIAREAYRVHPDPNLTTLMQRLTRMEQTSEIMDKKEAQKLRTLGEPVFEYGVFLGPSPTDENNVVVGYRGVRMEVKFSEELDIERDQLRQGQEVVLNSAQNILEVHENQLMPGEVAEVVNVLKPTGAGEVIELLEDRQHMRLKVTWREGEEIEVAVAESLTPLRSSLRKGSIVQIDDAGREATALARPTIHVRGGGSEGSVIEISDSLMREGVQIGNLVRYDPTLKYAFDKIVSNTSSKLSLEKVPDVTYEDIGGLEDIVTEIRNAIELPYIHRAKYRAYEMARPKGILLSGPPGCGKTLVAKAVANSLTSTIREHMREREQRLALYLDLTARPNDPGLRERYATLMGNTDPMFDPATAAERLREWFRHFDMDPNRAAEDLVGIRSKLNTPDAIRAYFLNVKGPELLSKWVGETERQIRETFDEARRAATFDSPVIIFFDEMESLFRTRGSGRSSDVETTIVPQFLAEIDGVEASENVIVIGATNRQDMIDPAFMRPGRFDRKFEIRRPNRRAAQEIIALTLLPTLPLDETTAPARSTLINNVVFRNAYRDATADSALGAVCAVKADTRLVRSLDENDIARLSALPREMTVGVARTRVGSENLVLKLNRFRSATTVGDLLAAVDKVRRASQTNPSIAQQLDRCARNEAIVEAMIDEAIEHIYADTSTIMVQTVDMTFKPRLREFVSGATLASVVERAKSRALKREISGEVTVGGGIRKQDVVDAVREEFEENKMQLAQYYVQSEQKRPADSIQNVELTLQRVNDDPWIQHKQRPYQVTGR